jgi:hypothetical protein
LLNDSALVYHFSMPWSRSCKETLSPAAGTKSKLEDGTPVVLTPPPVVP